MKKENIIQSVYNLIEFHNRSLELEKNFGIDLYESFHVLLYQVIDLFFETLYKEEGLDILNDFIYDKSEEIYKNRKEDLKIEIEFVVDEIEQYRINE